MGRYSSDPVVNQPNQLNQPIQSGFVSSNPYSSTPAPQNTQVNPMANWPTVFPKSVVALDLHGTIIENMGEDLNSPVLPLAGSLEAVKLLRLKGHKVFILADYPGIFSGKATTQQADSVHTTLMQLLGQAGCLSIDGLLYCTSSLKDDMYAKPNIGMIDRAKSEFRIDFGNGWYVGDSIEDLKMAEKAGLKPILVATGKGLETETKLDTYANRELKKKVQVFPDLLSFVQTL
jgi:HAD superfamily hydrolase (TIGR01662 family)